MTDEAGRLTPEHFYAAIRKLESRDYPPCPHVFHPKDLAYALENGAWLACANCFSPVRIEPRKGGDMEKRCVVKDTPDSGTCNKLRHATVTVAYTFSAPMEGQYVFDLDMCVDHATSLNTRVENDLAELSSRG